MAKRNASRKCEQSVKIARARVILTHSILLAIKRRLTSNEDHSMKLFRAPSPSYVSFGLAVLRIAAGVVFLDHGYQKLFKMGIGGVTGFFGQIGVPLPGVMATLITLLEVFGAVAIIVGFLTRPLALAFALDMLGAILLVQLKNGFSKFELEFLLLGTSVALFLTGAGRYSLDAMIAGRGEAAEPPRM